MEPLESRRAKGFVYTPSEEVDVLGKVKTGADGVKELRMKYAKTGRARVNRESNQQPIFTASTAPKDRRTGKPLPLKDWTLKSYIDVVHELGWISQSAKDVGVVLRDYRNYIHPQKELSHGITLTSDDTGVLWEVAKSISKQLLK
jgi:hypothetical protein